MKGDEEDKDTVGREENGEEIGEIYNIRGSPYITPSSRAADPSSPRSEQSEKKKIPSPGAILSP